MGTVLGASTLPFYDQPGTHLINLVYSASIGALTGMGFGVFQWLSGRSNQDQGEIMIPWQVSSAGGVSLREAPWTARQISVYASSMFPDVHLVQPRVRDSAIWAPVFSLTR